MGGMRPEAGGGVTGNFGRLAWLRPGSGRAGGDKLGPPGRDYPAGRLPERNSEGGDGDVIKMLMVPTGCWVIPGAEISGNGGVRGQSQGETERMVGTGVSKMEVAPCSNQIT